MIGSIQWAASIGRVDIQTDVMSMSIFCEQPQIGHLCCLRRMVGNLAKFRDFKIRFRVDPPDYSSVPDIPKQDWKYTPYGIQSEDLPLDEPEPKGKPIVLTHYFDANLIHDVLSGKAVTVTIHFWNKTPMDWFSKKQSTSETATYGSKFLLCRTCFKQAIDHQNPKLHSILRCSSTSD